MERAARSWECSHLGCMSALERPKTQRICNPIGASRVLAGISPARVLMAFEKLMHLQTCSDQGNRLSELGVLSSFASHSLNETAQPKPRMGRRYNSLGQSACGFIAGTPAQVMLGNEMKPQRGEVLSPGTISSPMRSNYSKDLARLVS
jgi:hypothetical protein